MAFDEYARQRKQLIDIYGNINLLFSNLNHVGTYFGHQSYRILGYAEYSISLLKGKIDDSETYDITRQKDLYVKSLRQLIDDKMEVDDVPFSEEEKEERSKEFNGFVDELDKLITDVFYLKRAQEFHYRRYDHH